MFCLCECTHKSENFKTQMFKLLIFPVLFMELILLTYFRNLWIRSSTLSHFIYHWNHESFSWYEAQDWCQEVWYYLPDCSRIWSHHKICHFENIQIKSIIELSWLINFLLVSAAWFFLRELIQICGLLNLGGNPFRNIKFYFHLIIIASTITFSILINNAQNELRTVSVLESSHVVVVFKLFYCVNFVFFISSLNKTFAVFTSGVIFVLKKLWAFLIMLTLIECCFV